MCFCHPGLSVPSISSFPYLCSIDLLEQCSAGQVDLRMCPQSTSGLVFLCLVLENPPPLCQSECPPSCMPRDLPAPCLQGSTASTFAMSVIEISIFPVGCCSFRRHRC
ncbi:hypothetical protein BDP81DRAFT_439344 [Colletotrichum phormii]|uniref:Keratin n=1 Tax=Colletotrichum phormii TaxID=359342 RepID=A0AAI9ZF17_9PEZI|nr:uncharacterized protein BDP81DRAFT_439344 [Colletotrichum phormii]KAK1623345.1 hypothetical protein BDP81DRAFT_439344 [Colletotrichum phormii]